MICSRISIVEIGRMSQEGCMERKDPDEFQVQKRKVYNDQRTKEKVHHMDRNGAVADGDYPTAD